MEPFPAADAFAAADAALRGRTRRRRARSTRASIEGDPFALGFLVGRGGTPNRVREDAQHGDADANDPEMPDAQPCAAALPVLSVRRTSKCASTVGTGTLQHRCSNADCPWPEDGLPFYVVDEEIYRLLPSVVVGTLDKAASVCHAGGHAWSVRSSSRVSAEGPGHGFTYAPRRRTPAVAWFRVHATARGAPTGRRAVRPDGPVQDELHLLRGGLGAIDAHYETLLDHLQRSTGGPFAKVIASSATLAGYESQVADALRTRGAAFPQPGPKEGVSFWTKDTDFLARRFVGLAPRGVTLEFANDRIAESLQRAVRRLLTEPTAVCAELGVDASGGRLPP